MSLGNFTTKDKNKTKTWKMSKKSLVQTEYYWTFKYYYDDKGILNFQNKYKLHC